MTAVSKAIGCSILCAWIMWSESYVNSEKMGAEILAAFNTLTDCEAGLTRMVERQKQKGIEVGPGTIHYSKNRMSALLCLPDTMKLN